MKTTQINVFRAGEYINLNDKNMYIAAVLIEAQQKVSYKLGSWEDAEFKTTWIDAEAMILCKDENPEKLKIGFNSQAGKFYTND